MNRLEDEPVTVAIEDKESGRKHAVRVDHLIARSVAEDGYSDTSGDEHPMAAWPADIIEMYRGGYEGLAREALDEEIEGYDYIPSAAYFLYDCASGISRARQERLDHPESSGNSVQGAGLRHPGTRVGSLSVCGRLPRRE